MRNTLLHIDGDILKKNHVKVAEALDTAGLFSSKFETYIYNSPI